jgi:glycosyltransferase involved in cell wall biosynthesis
VSKPRVLVCGSQVPFERGGAEALVASLAGELGRRGFDVDVVALPFNWGTRLQVLRSAMAWRLLDLAQVAGRPVDRVIATRFPSYAVAHPSKVVWLVHQLRQAYDLLGTRWGDFTDSPEDREAVAMVRAIDGRVLGEAVGLYGISRNVTDRLRRYNQLEARPLYPPPPLDGRFRCDGYRGFVMSVGRLDRMKRFDLLVRALAHTGSNVRCVIAGDGPEREALRELAASNGVGERLELPGRVDDARLLELYATCSAVYYAPYDEDYGYVTIEAFKAGKPVVTAADAGGVLEHVVDGRNGYVVDAASPRRLAARLDELAGDEALARRLGEAGREHAAPITWDRVVAALTGWEEG